MRGKSELYWSFLAIGVITVVYLIYSLFAGIPEASSLLGHLLGVGGFLLMLGTETLYSIRKRAMHKPWGRLQTWLKFHIFTGIVGPYLVFLHTAWSFSGMAGVVVLLTAIVVLSGFIGRYIYTSVPRTADGLIVAAEMLQAQLASLESELNARWSRGAEILPMTRMVPVSTRSTNPRSARPSSKDLLQIVKNPGLPAKDRAVLTEIRQMQQRQRKIRRQIKNLAFARRALSIWHTIHIPLGMAMFTAAIFHIAAAIYFSTMLR